MSCFNSVIGNRCQQRLHPLAIVVDKPGQFLRYILSPTNGLMLEV
ncbi:Uncharacterised protein [Serratia fonticola]|nr:hypothetical protein L581_2120 [Serratia fonticola AU-AP2C]QIP93334.1 hypothetical protein HAP32_03854 [Serratia fonticola]RDL27088.1 hypothetical protein DFO62_103511 [Serratia fonticola]CAI0827611.1 Uncharacterised protein [Serratia fonticola]CAI1174678.1 Uncharacterised protein [Serratia fonticola]